MNNFVVPDYLSVTIEAAVSEHISISYIVTGKIDGVECCRTIECVAFVK